MSGNKSELFFILAFLSIEGKVYRRKFDFFNKFFCIRLVYGYWFDRKKGVSSPNLWLVMGLLGGGDYSLVTNI